MRHNKVVTVRGWLITALCAALAITILPATRANAIPQTHDVDAITPVTASQAAPYLDTASKLIGEGASQQPTASQSTTDAAVAQTEAQAQSAAVKQGTPVEDLSARSETSQTFANPDGSLTLKQSEAPVRVQQKDGSWADVDYTLARRADGSYAPRVSPNDIVVGGGGSDTVASVKFEDGSTLAVSWPQALPVPEVKGGVATYRLNEDMDLLAVMVGGGVSVRVRFNRVPTPEERALVFGLHTDGVKVAESSTGGLRVTDDSGTAVANSGSLVAWDARKDEAGDPLKLVPISAELETTSGTGLNQRQDLSLSTPAGFLDDPATVYPVIIDPDIVESLGRTKDTYVRYGDTVAHGTSYGLAVGRSSTDANAALTYMQFNTANVTGNRVLSASLQLWQYQANTCASRTMYIKPIATSWADTITYANDPNPEAAPPAPTTPASITTMHGGSCGAGGWVSGDVTNIVNDWARGAYANNGFQFSIPSANAGDLSYERRFCSMELSGLSYCNSATVFPTLSVTYRTDPASTAGGGDRPFYQYESQQLTDRIGAKVNVGNGNGNLLITAHDAKVAGIAGMDLAIDRYYNSIAASAPGADRSGLGAGWSSSLGGSVRLEFPSNSDDHVDFFGPSGYRVHFDKNGSNYDHPSPGFKGKLVSEGGYLKVKLNDKTAYWFLPYQLDFAKRGRLVETTDKQGNTLHYTYSDSTGALALVTDTRSRQAVMGYDSSGRLSTITVQKPNGSSWTDLLTFSYTYDTSNRLASSKLSYLNTTSGGLPDTSDSVNVGALTTYSYDGNGRLSQIKDARENSAVNGTDGGTTTFQYDSTGKLYHLNRLTDDSSLPDSVTEFTYASTVTGTNCAGNGDGATARSAVDGPRSGVADTTVYCLDDKTRVLRTIDPNNHIRKKTYDDNSNVQTADDSGLSSGGNTFRMSYSGDNMTSETTPSSDDTNNDPSNDPTATFSYNDSANPNFPTGMRDFDRHNDGDSSNTWDYDYDDNGNLIDATASMKGDPAKKITYRYCWDGNGQLQRIDPIDNAGNNSVAKDENLSAGCGTANQGNDTLLSYDSLGQLTQIDPPGTNGTQTYTYDALSRVATVTDGRGVVVTYTYDGLDRVVAEDFNPPYGSGMTNATVQWTYDADGNRTQVQDPTGTETFTYDELNRRHTQSRGTGTPTKTYTYDQANNLTSFQVSGEPEATTYTYDNKNLLLSVDDPRAGSNTITFVNDAHDRRVKTTFPMTGGNNLVQRVKYDDGGLVRCVYSYRENNNPVSSDPNPDDPACPAATAAGLITYHRYTYTHTITVGSLQVTIKTRTRYKVTDKGGVETAYDYDPIGRLNHAAVTMGTGTGSQLRDFDYTYDRHSNINKEITSGGTPGLGTGTTYSSYDVADELCWTASTDSGSCTTTPSGGTSYTFDGAGSTSGNSAAMDFDYNAIGQTSAITPAGAYTSIPMTYTGVTQDRRITKDNTDMSYGFSGMSSQSVSGHKYWFVRDPGGQLLALVDSATSSPDAPKYYLTDAQQTVLATMDTSGVTRRYLYEPYGQRIRTWFDATPDANTSTGHTPPDGSETTTASTAADPNPWGYVSGYFDKETGLLKFGTRYYLPTIGRWTQVDPKAGDPSSPLTMNPYLYSGDDPTNTQDPSGRFSLDHFVEGFDVLKIVDDVASQQYGDALADTLGTLTGGLAGSFCGAIGLTTLESGPGFVAAEAGCVALGSGLGEYVAESSKDNYMGFNQ